jgi:hypothetical protein
MKRHSTVCIGNWAANGQARRLIENVFADNYRLLFMAAAKSSIL